MVMNSLQTNIMMHKIVQLILFIKSAMISCIIYTDSLPCADFSLVIIVISF
jgi:hypothetical protein